MPVKRYADQVEWVEYESSADRTGSSDFGTAERLRVIATDRDTGNSFIWNGTGWTTLSGEGGGSAVSSISRQITTADLTAAALSQNFTLASAIPANGLYFGVGLTLTTNFTGGTVTATEISFGFSDVPNVPPGGLAASSSWDGSDSKVNLANLTTATPAQVEAPGAIGGSSFPYSGATPQVTFTATGGNVDTLTAGDATVRFYYLAP